ncbi:MAG: phage portal protein, partial [Candidatus Thermoplasmatota archaeon]|nr:phage portal protein [Candidatus Thermoplasmatota archaeon]
SAGDAFDVGAINRYFNDALQKGPGRVVVMPLEQGIEENLQSINLKAEPRDVVSFINECRDQIARVHGVPLRLLSIAQAASLGSATEAATQIDYFREFVVRPRQVLWETILYQILLSQRWPEWKIAFRQLTTEDALKMAQADALSVRTGIISPNEARSRRALGPVPGGDEVVFLSAGGQPLPVRTLGEWQTLPPNARGGTEGDALENAEEEKASRKGTEVQSVLCPNDKFDSAAEAAAWCREHGFKADKLDETDEHYRYRQFPPNLCEEGSFRTISLGDKAKAVVCRIAASEEKETKATGMEVQSVLCPKDKFKSAEEAAAWCREHGFKTDKLDETDDFYRYRQFQPELCEDGSFRTMRLGDKAKAVVCRIRT